MRSFISAVVLIAATSTMALAQELTFPGATSSPALSTASSSSPAGTGGITSTPGGGFGNSPTERLGGQIAPLSTTNANTGSAVISGVPTTTTTLSNPLK